MGKRVASVSTDVIETHQAYVSPVSTSTKTTRSIRKRKCPSDYRTVLHDTNINGQINNDTLDATCPKTLRLQNSSPNNHYWSRNENHILFNNKAANLSLPTSSHNTLHFNSSLLLYDDKKNIQIMNESKNESDEEEQHNNSIPNPIESPKPVYTLRPSVVNDTVLRDLNQRLWRLGKPIGKGNFGEIFLASNNMCVPVTKLNANFVVKIEPHSNGPLFVEIHCLMNTSRRENSLSLQPESPDIKDFSTKASAQKSITISPPMQTYPPTGIPNYIGSGSHYFGNTQYRFLVLPRYESDLHSLIKNCRVHQKFILLLAIQIINVLEKLHDKGYCHNDVKAQNLMLSKCKYYKKRKKQDKIKQQQCTASFVGDMRLKIKTTKCENDEKQQTTDSGNSSEQEEINEDTKLQESFVIKRKSYNNTNYKNKIIKNDCDVTENDDEDEDFNDMMSNSTNSNLTEITPINKINSRHRTPKTVPKIEYCGSNPVRSCRREKRNSMYEEMVKSHYLRPTKRISYSEFFVDECLDGNFNDVHWLQDSQDISNSRSTDMNSINSSYDDDSDEFIPHYIRRKSTNKKKNQHTTTIMTEGAKVRRTTRCQTLKNDKGNKITTTNENLQKKSEEEWIEVEEERVFLIDYGLASKYIDNGIHRPFVMDQRRAHDGTLEFTSRDAHMGAHSRRSDMECLGYNLLFWSQGYLPWKDASVNQQQEKVHRAKEYLMTDVREMLQQIYGKDVPKYLGEYLHLVGQLSYHERPNYQRYRYMFEQELKQLGYSLNDVCLNMNEIRQTCIRNKDKDLEGRTDFFEVTKTNGVSTPMLNIIHNLTANGTLINERTTTTRVSPKNLRSKSNKKILKKKIFSWTEILSQDPDQIARERAEKEFDREEELSEIQQPTLRRYEGKPTYAILQILNRLRQNGRLGEDSFRFYRHRNDFNVKDCNYDEAGQLVVHAAYSAEGYNNCEIDSDSNHGISSQCYSTNRKSQRQSKSTKFLAKKSSIMITTPKTPPNNYNELTYHGKDSKTVLPTPLRNKAKTTNKNSRNSGTLKKNYKTLKGSIKHLPISYDITPFNGRQSSMIQQKRERPVRRCLIKDETKPAYLIEDSSNSNCSPDVRCLLDDDTDCNNQNNTIDQQFYLRNSYRK